MLTTPPALYCFRRHTRTCRHRRRGRDYSLCDCPIWCDGTLNGERLRRSLNTTDWQRASDRLEAIAAGKQDPLLLPPTPVGIAEAAQRFIADGRMRRLRESTLTSYSVTLAHLAEFFSSHGLRYVTVDTLDRFRAWRQCAGSTQRKELEHLRAFCDWALDRGWLYENPARRLRPPVAPGSLPTLPFTDAEVAQLIEACGRIASDNQATNPLIRSRARALVLTLLYSGLRISDVAGLRREALAGAYLTLRAAKTGVPVKVKLHPDAAAALERLPPRDRRYFFWNGTAKLSTLIGNMRTTITRLGRLAGVPNAHPHRFRDTFACGLLARGVQLRTVQLLLGHTSIRTTERHYAPFVLAQQRLLDEATERLEFSHQRPQWLENSES